MATVYLWGNLGPTGHVSVEFLQTQNSSRYTSWHPKNEDPKYLDAFVEVPGEFRHGAYDKQNHPRGYADAVSVAGLDEHAMEQRHESLKAAAASGRLKYCLRTYNCARVAADVLSHGKHHGVTFMQHVDVVLHRVLDHRAKRVHYNLPDLIQDASKALSASLLRAHPFVRAAAMLPVLTETLYWSPRDVVELARLYNEGHF